jgi:hypothetical protein
MPKSRERFIVEVNTIRVASSESQLFTHPRKASKLRVAD